MQTMQNKKSIGRRSFLKTVSFCSATLLFKPFAFGADEKLSTVRFGLISDVHQDVMHDAPERVKAFVDAMHETKADFICQLGDFCWPHQRNRKFMDQWKQFDGLRYHTLGNHDMDGGFSSDQTVAFYEMPSQYYSFDNKGVHFIVLDGNEPGGKSKGYKRYISGKQLEWIKKDLSATTLPTIVFLHQPLYTSDGIENSEVVRKVLEQFEIKAGHKKVIAAFCGHHHKDHATQINDIHYVNINSASYVWLGGKFKHESYDKEIHRKHPYIQYTAPYKAPLWALIDIDLANGKLVVKGRKTTWVGPSPKQLGVDEKIKATKTSVPWISDRELSW